MSATILIVDDSFVMRSVLNQIISPYPDFNIIGEASNGVEALKKMHELHPDIVLLDLEMPKMNGIECLIQIKKCFNSSVIIISALNKMSIEEINHIKNLGADDIIEKPSGSLSINLGTHRSEHIIDSLKTVIKCQ
jgi:two-component system chemotaxis response regulator CheB